MEAIYLPTNDQYTNLQIIARKAAYEIIKSQSMVALELIV